jgi:hypothetical protein
MKFRAITSDELGGVDVQDDTEGEVWLSVPQFAAQPEVDKHPSQIYGWLKRGLPFEMQQGQKRIEFSAGLAWIQERQSMSRSAKRAVAATSGVAGRGKISATFADVNKGDYLKWDRQNGLGPAYAMVTGFSDGLAILSVEYRSRPVYFEKGRLLKDISKGLVKIVHPTEVFSFLLEQISRLDFFVHTFVGPEKAKEFSLLVKESGVVPLGLAERFHAFSTRPSAGWPGEGALEDLELAAKTLKKGGEEEKTGDS